MVSAGNSPRDRSPLQFNPPCPSPSQINLSSSITPPITPPINPQINVLPSLSTTSVDPLLPAAVVPPFTPSSQLNFIKPQQLVTLKLTTKNYLFWRNLLTPLLRSQGLYSHVDGSVPAPPPYIIGVDGQLSHSNPEYESWYPRDQYVLALLQNSLSDEVLALALGPTTARELWVSLENSLASASSSRSMHLQAALRDLDQNDLSITTYLSQAKVLHDELQAIGKAPSFEDFLTKVLLGLHPDYHEMRAAIIARSGSITFEELHSLLKTQEYMLASRPAATSQSQSPVPMVHQVQQGVSPPVSGPSRQQQFSPRGRGGRGAYLNRGGRRDARVYRQQFRTQRVAECQWCGALGHQASSCFKLTRPPASAPSAMHVQGSSDGFQSRSNVPWYPDTGASHHVTPDLAGLQHYEDYSGSERVHVANGTGQSHGDNASYRSIQ